MLRRTLLTTGSLLIGAIALLIGGTAWLVASESGLQTAIRLAGKFSAGSLQIEQASGRLIGPLDITSLRWETTDLKVHAEQLHLDWSPGALLQNRLQIADLSLGKVHISSAPSSTPTPPPVSLLLPAAVNVEKLAILRLEYGTAFAAEQIAARFSSDGRQHRLSEFRVDSSGASLLGRATLDGAAPLTLEASAEINGQLEQHPLAVALKASGPLERLALSAVAEKGIEGEAQIELTPFASAALSSARIALKNIDPAAWQDGAPSATFDLLADLKAKGDGIAGSFSLHNSRPGRLDRQRLPLASLTGQLDWQGETTVLNSLDIQFANAGKLSGSGQLKGSQLELKLAAHRLNAANIHSAMRPTQLSGPISATLSAEQQSVKLDWRDSQFTLLAEASRSGELLSLAKLQLGTGEARLTGQGELRLDQDMAFTAEGELSRFDPSRFAKVPAALINARFSAQGKLQPQPVIDGNFELRDSKMADQILAGHGKLKVDWPRIPQADIELTLGVNKLNARGAFGQPGDRLQLVIDAPQLSPYGLEGGVSGQFDLAGSVQQPKISGQLQAAKLGLPGQGLVRGLTLQVDLGREPASPLRLELAIDQFDTPDQDAVAKALSLRVEGSNQAHRLKAGVNLIGDNKLSLAAEGGLKLGAASPSWQGRLLEAKLNSPDASRNFRLTAPAALSLAADQWSFGPARLAGDPLDWQATLQANAENRQVRASLSASGSRIGPVDGQFTAGLLSAWSLNSQAPWQGRLKLNIADLGWLAELIGDQWQSEGRLDGELELAGSPARPLASGRFRGDKLALRLPEQGFNLANGELAIDLADNRLRVNKLAFDSLLKTPPRALRFGGRNGGETPSDKPGRLEISGEITVDRSKGAESAFLDIHLERLGAFQLPDQWITLSGDGRLNWQDDTLAVKGKLGVDAGYWQLAPGGSPQLSDDVIVKRPGSAKTASPLRPKLDLDISTDLGRNFFFNGAGLSSRLVGDIRLRATGRDLPRATGRIRARDGRFDAYGQKLEIERGILTFQGLLDNPALDVRAVRKGLPVEPGVQISGTVQKPVVRLVSDPELPEAEKLAWLVLGHGPEQMGAGDAAVLFSAAGGLLGNNSGNVVQQLKNTFALDEFGVRQGELGGGGRQAGSRVAGGAIDTTGATGNQILSVGKRLSSNAMLSYEQTLGKAEGIVKLTVNLSRQISVVGRAGSDNAIDIFYTITFGQPPRRTTRQAKPDRERRAP